MNKHLKSLKQKYTQLITDLTHTYNDMDKIIKPFLFLFDSSIYVDSRHFNYNHSEEKGVQQFDSNDWFVSITYHPGNLLLIETGYNTLNIFEQRDSQYDETPEVEKLQAAFRNRIRKINTDKKDKIDHTNSMIALLKETSSS